MTKKDTKELLLSELEMRFLENIEEIKIADLNKDDRFEITEKFKAFVIGKLQNL